MNHQGVSEIFFGETYNVPPRRLEHYSHGSDYSAKMIECLSTGYLVAVVESICIREMQQYVAT